SRHRRASSATAGRAGGRHGAAWPGRSVSPRTASPDVAPAVPRWHALARELDPLAVPRLAREPPHLEGAEPGRPDPALQHPRRRLGGLGDEVALKRHQHRSLLLGGQALGDVDLPSVVGLEHAGLLVARSLLLDRYRGMLPCLRAGTASRLVDSIRNALINRGRVSAGSITSSMN